MRALDSTEVNCVLNTYHRSLTENLEGFILLKDVILRLSHQIFMNGLGFVAHTGAQRFSRRHYVVGDFNKDILAIAVLVFGRLMRFRAAEHEPGADHAEDRLN